MEWGAWPGRHEAWHLATAREVGLCYTQTLGQYPLYWGLPLESRMQGLLWHSNYCLRQVVRLQHHGLERLDP